MDNYIETILLICNIFAILLLTFILSASLYTTITIFRYNRVYRQIRSLVDDNTKVIFVTSLEKNKNTDLLRIISFVVRSVVDTFYGIDKSKRIVFDIDESSKISSSIRHAYESNMNIWIFIESNGGSVTASDDICTTIKTYQHLAKRSGKKKKITCIVNTVAMSAATMLALSGDVLRMSDFAVLGPTDPQCYPEGVGEYISCGLYQKVKPLYTLSVTNSTSKSVMTDLLTMQNNIECYEDNFVTFSSLEQVNRLDKKHKEEVIDIFCTGKIPHSRSINVPCLKTMGFKIHPLTPNQIEIIDLLNKSSEMFYHSLECY